jgi:hypothetical protein
MTLRLMPALCCTLAALAAAYPSGGGAQRRGGRQALKTVEGEVYEIGSATGEGGVEIVVIEIRPDPTSGETTSVGLAPAPALDDAGFDVSVGDTVRVRIFVGTPPVSAHKILNLSRSTMLRLRTLHRDPLWDSAGRWLGERYRHRGGPAGPGRGEARGPHR